MRPIHETVVGDGRVNERRPVQAFSSVQTGPAINELWAR